ncbi:MAG TPA: NEW3 domain-containing protein [Patescibacteria group bacterium]|nr:NEW3 domain-containing protein [Patescibacteria group bacterium]
MAKTKRRFSSFLLILMLLILPILVIGVLTAKYISPKAYLVLPTPTAISSPRPTASAPPYNCTGSPVMKLLPNTQSARAGTPLTYTIRIQNNDRLTCPKTTFNLSAFEIPSGWTTILASTSVQVGPQKSVDVKVTFKSPTLAKPGNYKVGILANFYNYGLGVQANYLIIPSYK